MSANSLDDLVADLVDGIHRVHSSLKDDGDLLPTKLPHIFLREWNDIGPVEDDLAIGVTCVRVPVLRAHSQAITFECEKPISESQVRTILADAPGVKIVDDRANNYFPMPRDASGQDDVLVGRIRKDLSDPSGHSISMFVAADQLLKGAALNAIQIAELLPQRDGVK